jgi:tetratricopeptide (TPR) repeat protein
MTTARTLDAVRALWDAGRHDEHYAAAMELVAREPDSGAAHVEAALAYERRGRARDALRHYEIAFQLGVPVERRRSLYVGYGSILRSLGRADDAVGVLGQALAEDPGYAPYAAFLALALLDAGHARAALATMLGCALDVARPGAFGGHEAALVEHQRLLLEPAQ